MKPLDCITVGLSLSESDQHLLSYAAMLARMGVGKKIQFVHVSAPQPAPPTQADLTETRKQMESSVAQQFGSVGTHVQRTFAVCEGVLIDQLLAHTERHPADAVLLGHHQEGSGRHSLAERMAMICPTTVWMVPNQAPCQIRRVLAPTDFSAHSADSVCLATALSQQAGLSECLALHVYFDASTIRYDESIAEDHYQAAIEFEQFLGPLELHGVTVTPLIEEVSNVSKAILRIASAQQCDLIVMSTRGRSRAAVVLLGSETSQTLIESGIPVVAVKHRGAFLNLFQALKDQEIWTTSEAKTN